MIGTLTPTTEQDPDAWLSDLFSDAYCDECGGDAPEHTAVPLLDNWFARCDHPRTGGARRLLRERAR